MHNKKGFTLIEVLIALALLGIIMAAILNTLSTSFNADLIHNVQTTAESLARSEMEYVRKQDYLIAPWSYDLPQHPPDWDTSHALDPRYSNYTVSVNSIPLDADDHGIQKITVIIIHDDEVITLESYKSGR